MSGEDSIRSSIRKLAVQTETPLHYLLPEDVPTSSDWLLEYDRPLREAHERIDRALTPIFGLAFDLMTQTEYESYEATD